MKKLFTLLCLLVVHKLFCFSYIAFTDKDIDGAGNSWTVLQNQSSSNDGSYSSVIEVAYTPYGSPLQPSIQLSDSTYWSESPRIAVNHRGDAVAVWVGYDSIIDSRVIFASTLVSGDNWTTPVRLSSYDEIALDGYSVELSDVGEIVVTWNSYVKEYSYTYSIACGHVNGTWYPAQRDPAYLQQ